MSRAELELSGALFEMQIYSLLQREYPDAIVLNNLELFSAYLNKDTQIDIVLICNKGVCFIEAKNWVGWIQGNYNDLSWKGKSRSPNIMKVFNPINQNKIHIRAVKNALRLQNVHLLDIQNIVCLPDGCDLRTNCSDVVNYSNLVTKINDYLSRSKQSIDCCKMNDAILKCCRRA